MEFFCLLRKRKGMGMDMEANQRIEMTAQGKSVRVLLSSFDSLRFLCEAGCSQPLLMLSFPLYSYAMPDRNMRS